MLRGLLAEKWLEVVEDVMKIYSMTNAKKIQYVSLLLKHDAKVC